MGTESVQRAKAPMRGCRWGMSLGKSSPLDLMWFECLSPISCAQGAAVGQVICSLNSPCVY